MQAGNAATDPKLYEAIHDRWW